MYQYAYLRNHAPGVTSLATARLAAVTGMKRRCEGQSHDMHATGADYTLIIDFHLSQHLLEPPLSARAV